MRMKTMRFGIHRESGLHPLSRGSLHTYVPGGQEVWIGDRGLRIFGSRGLSWAEFSASLSDGLRMKERFNTKGAKDASKSPQADGA
jgi:hypothetical protein